MNKRIVAFGASNSKNSINRKLAYYAANEVEGADVMLLDLNDFEMPIYSIDREREGGIPELAHKFRQILEDADGIVISFAEHNGTYSVAYKNIYDWMSRINRDVWFNKPMFLLATSPGGKGGKSVLNQAVTSAGFTNSNTVVSFSLPSFNKNFTEELGLINADVRAQFIQQLQTFTRALQNQTGELVDENTPQPLSQK